MSTELKQRGRKGRPNYPLDFKRALAQQACEPGVSVLKLALLHGINANQLFRWRRHYRAGLFDVTPLKAATLLPVSVIERPPAALATGSPRGLPQSASPAPSVTGAFIEVQLADIVVRVGNGAEAATLRAVLEALRR